MTWASRSSISDRFLRSEQGVRKWDAGKVWGQEVLHKLMVHMASASYIQLARGKMGQCWSEINQAHCTRGHRMS